MHELLLHSAIICAPSSSIPHETDTPPTTISRHSFHARTQPQQSFTRFLFAPPHTRDPAPPPPHSTSRTRTPLHILPRLSTPVSTSPAQTRSLPCPSLLLFAHPAELTATLPSVSFYRTSQTPPPSPPLLTQQHQATVELLFPCSASSPFDSKSSNHQYLLDLPCSNARTASSLFCSPSRRNASSPLAEPAFFFGFLLSRKSQAPLPLLNRPDQLFSL